LTFALTGFGEALVDDVTIHKVRLASMPSYSDPATRGAIAPGNATADNGTNPAVMPPQASRATLEQAQRMRQIFSFPRR
jgi:hypothetical protein